MVLNLSWLAAHFAFKKILRRTFNSNYLTNYISNLEYLAAHLEEAHGTPVEKHWLWTIKMQQNSCWTKFDFLNILLTLIAFFTYYVLYNFNPKVRNKIKKMFSRHYAFLCYHFKRQHMHQKIFTKAIQTTFSYLMEHKCEDDSNKLLLIHTLSQSLSLSLSLSLTHTLCLHLSYSYSHTDTHLQSTPIFKILILSQFILKEEEKRKNICWCLRYSISHSQQSKRFCPSKKASGYYSLFFSSQNFALFQT